MTTLAKVRELVSLLLRHSPSFTSLVKKTFGPMALRHGMKVIKADRNYLLEKVTYVNATRAIVFWYDLRDQEVGCRYGPAPSPTESNPFGWSDLDAFVNVHRRLRLLGVKLPEGFDELVGKDRLPEAVALLVWGLERFEKEIFPSD